MAQRGHDGSFNFVYHPGTISFDEWLRLARRYVKRNPEAADQLNPATIRRAKRVAQEYQNRHNN